MTMTEQEEKFVHFTSSIERFNDTWRILQQIKKDKGHPLVIAAFRFALVQYSIPYKGSRSAEAKRKWHYLDSTYIPKEHFALHERLLAERDQLHAHDDLSVKDAALHVRDTADGPIVTKTQNKTYGIDEFGNIDAIIDLIEKTVKSMRADQLRLQQDLKPNSGSSWLPLAR